MENLLFLGVPILKHIRVLFLIINIRGYFEISMVEILSDDCIGKAICLFTGYFMNKFASSAVQIKQLLIRVDTVYLLYI